VDVYGLAKILFEMFAALRSYPKNCPAVRIMRAELKTANQTSDPLRRLKNSLAPPGKTRYPGLFLLLANSSLLDQATNPDPAKRPTPEEFLRLLTRNSMFGILLDGTTVNPEILARLLADIGAILGLEGVIQSLTRLPSVVLDIVYDPESPAAKCYWNELLRSRNNNVNAFGQFVHDAASQLLESWGLGSFDNLVAAREAFLFEYNAQIEALASGIGQTLASITQLSPNVVKLEGQSRATVGRIMTELRGGKVVPLDELQLHYAVRDVRAQVNALANQFAWTKRHGEASDALKQRTAAQGEINELDKVFLRVQTEPGRKLLGRYKRLAMAQLDEATLRLQQIENEAQTTSDELIPKLRVISGQVGRINVLLGHKDPAAGA
jgi:hypothetical protein